MGKAGCGDRQMSSKASGKNKLAGRMPGVPEYKRDSTALPLTHPSTPPCLSPGLQSAPGRGLADPQHQHPGPGSQLKVTDHEAAAPRGAGESCGGVEWLPQYHLLRLKALALAVRSICLRFPARTFKYFPRGPTVPGPRVRRDSGVVRTPSRPCPHLTLQLLGDLLYPLQRLLRFQLLQAEQGQAQLILLGEGEGEASDQGIQDSRASSVWATRQDARLWKHPYNAKTSLREAAA